MSEPRPVTPRSGAPRRSRRVAKKALIVAGATAAAAALGVIGERHLIRKARTGPDPERGEPLEERPGEERRIRSFDGTELAAHVAGPAGAPVLVMVHGFSADLTLWHYQWKHFSRSYRCVLYDQRGHGRSGSGTGGDYSLEAMAGDLKAVLDETAPGASVALLGHSMGGMVAMSLAEHFPDEFGTRVKATVLANTAAAELIRAAAGSLGAKMGKLVAAAAIRAAKDPRRVYRIRARALAGQGDLAFAAARLTNFGPNPPPSLVEHVARVGARAPVEVWTDLLGSLVEMDLSHALAHITVPALVIVGDVDRITPPASALAIKRMLPDGRLIVFKGSGHCTMLERHAQFNRVVEGFLAEALGDATRTEERPAPHDEAGREGRTSRAKARKR
jgi:pimeloyl-ACP methyl ester carboxylesterase